MNDSNRNNQNNNNPIIPSDMKLPSTIMDKGIIRKTLIDENGMTYEIEQEIDLPIIIHKDDNK